jgi:hypothetical protein
MLATQSNAVVLEKSLIAEHYFLREEPALAIGLVDRQSLYDTIEWSAQCFILRRAQKLNVTDGLKLRQIILKDSGIETLKKVLHSQFFALSGLIKASTALRKAWDPCISGLLKLREATETQRKNLSLGERSIKTISDTLPISPELAEIGSYIESTLTLARGEINRLERTRLELDAIKSQASIHFEFLDEDLRCLDLINQTAGALISEEECTQLHRLFGELGPELETRLGVSLK